MNKTLLGLMAAVVISSPAMAQNVGVSISVGDPGFYGRIDIGDVPQPRLIYREPILVERVRVGEPVYLHVPPGHAKDWKKHCRHYDACGRPVYFVDDDWYNTVYVPRYREVRARRDNDGGHDHDHDRGHDHDDRGGKGNGNGKNKGNNGKGNGNGKGG